jgi:hypothetical protein
MAIIIEAPKEIYSTENNHNIKLFLAGGITNCPDWQSYIVNELKDVDKLTIYNPRRKKFPMNDPNAAEEQITWEYNHLRDADILFFWFSRGSLNPIVLYELGMWCNSSDKIAIIGMDPEYERKQDVIIQTKLARPFLQIFDSLQDMINEVNYIFNNVINTD